MKDSEKVVLITGGANGIGLAAARAFLQQGAKVMIADLDQDALESARESLHSDQLKSCRVDVTDAASNDAMVRACVDALGRIDVFIANAGIEGRIGSIEDSSVENFDAVMAVNVRGAWLGLHYVIPVMKSNGGGSIIITSSGAGVQGSPMLAPYNTSKHAVIGLMRCAAKEVAPHGIRVNTVNPGMIETRMAKSIEVGFGGTEEANPMKEAVLGTTPMGRYGSPEEVANIMLFLASEQASYCTGGVYMVDGGQSS